MHLIDLEFSETLELNHRISGGFSVPENFTLNTDIDVDLDLDINVDFDPDLQNVNLKGGHRPVLFPENASLEDFFALPFVGDQIVETPGSIVVDNPSVSQPLCL